MTRLIRDATARMPGDANVHYSAGIIHFKCGDQPRAATELRTAVDIAPVDSVMAQALGIVAPGPPPPSATPRAVRKQIDELLRVDAEGLGKVGCEFFNASARFNLRAFAEAVTR